MLTITIPAQNHELFDNKTNEFLTLSLEKEQTLCLEHSLVSISKWESKWHKPFLSKDKKTDEELRDYIRCMTISQNIDPKVYQFLTKENFLDVNKYIEDPMTATTFNNKNLPNTPKGTSEFTTSELIYYWMISLEIPFECQRWHLNRLLTLIRICNVKNNPGKKMSKKDIMSNNRALNAARRQRMHSKG